MRFKPLCGPDAPKSVVFVTSMEKDVARKKMLIATPDFLGLDGVERQFLSSTTPSDLSICCQWRTTTSGRSPNDQGRTAKNIQHITYITNGCRIKYQLVKL